VVGYFSLGLQQQQQQQDHLTLRSTPIMAKRLSSTNSLHFNTDEKKVLNAIFETIFAELATKMAADGSNANLPTTNPNVAGAIWSNSGDVVRSAG